MSNQTVSEADRKKTALERFIAAVDAAGGQSVAAFQLGITESGISRICSGNRGISLDVAFRIQAIYGIDMEDWVEKPEPELVKRFAKK